MVSFLKRRVVVSEQSCSAEANGLSFFIRFDGRGDNPMTSNTMIFVIELEMCLLVAYENY